MSKQILVDSAERKPEEEIFCNNKTHLMFEENLKSDIILKRIKNKNSLQYKLTERFFNECKVVLEAKIFKKVIETFKLYQDELLEKNKAIETLVDLLTSHNRLISELKHIFS